MPRHVLSLILVCALVAVPAAFDKAIVTTLTLPVGNASLSDLSDTGDVAVIDELTKQSIIWNEAAGTIPMNGVVNRLSDNGSAVGYVKDATQSALYWVSSTSVPIFIGPAGATESVATAISANGRSNSSPAASISSSPTRRTRPSSCRCGRTWPRSQLES